MVSHQERLGLLRKLCETCADKGSIPKSIRNLDFPEDDMPIVYYGGHSNVSKGEHEGREVAVKVLRTDTTSDFDAIRGVGELFVPEQPQLKWCLQRFCREVVIWRHLRHPNILPLFGVTSSEQRFATVSEWMENGTINEFTKKYQKANRIELVSHNYSLQAPN